MFCISISTDGRKILQQFYSSSFEEKHRQCIVKEKIISAAARLSAQVFDLLIVY